MAYATKEKRNAYARKYQSQPHIKEYKKKYHENRTEKQKQDKIQYDLERHAKYRQHYRAHNLKYRTDWKNKALDKLGNRCANPDCAWINADLSKGCTDPRCLQIDHVAGDGSKERKGEAGYYRRVSEDVTGKYQLLCANCNWIKRFVNKEHRGRPRLNP